jgi:CHAD domain-containing protein
MTTTERENGSAPKASAYVVAKLRELDAALVAAAPRVVHHPDDEEAVHDLRVAIRRMRTLLKMSRGLFGRWHTDVVRGAFAEVMRATGDLRDEEVLEETLSDAVQTPEFDAWLLQRRVREEKLRRNVIARIERGDLDRARLMLKALLVFPVEPDRNVDLSRFARRTVEGARRKVEGRRDVEVSDVTGMHDLRIAYKELRYSIELLSDALPIDARAQLEPATVFQKRLGELHDVDVATDVVRDAKGLSPDARAEALSSLARMRDKRVGKYLRELDPLGAAVVSSSKSPAALPSPPDVPVLIENRADAETVGIEAVLQNGGAPPLQTPETPDETGGPPPSSVEDAPTVHIKNWDLRRSPQK